MGSKGSPSGRTMTRTLPAPASVPAARGSFPAPMRIRAVDAPWIATLFRMRARTTHADLPVETPPEDRDRRGTVPGCPAPLPDRLRCAARSSAAPNRCEPAASPRGSCGVRPGAACSRTSTHAPRCPSITHAGRGRRHIWRSPEPWSAAGVLWGVDLAGPDDDVECTLAPGCRAGGLRGIQVTRRALPPDEVTWCRGVRVTAVGRTALDLARIQPVEEAVVALDQFLGAGLLTMGRLRTAAAAATGPGCRQIRRAVDLADGLAESPQETRLRLLLHQSPLPRPIAQYSVREGTRFVARVDFAWPDAKVAVEYEGMWHGRPQQVARDRRRLNQLTAAGWTVVFVTAADLYDPVQVIARIAAALAARSYA